jgi:hypothetical protein
MKKSGLADSPFFQSPPRPVETQRTAEQPVYQAPPQPNDRTSERPVRVDDPVRPVRDVLPERPIRREIRRHSFEFYRDQIERLQEIKIAYMRSGEMKSMSAIVREAVDDYLKRHT